MRMMKAVTKILPLLYFGFFTALSCFKLGYMLRFQDAGFEHSLDLLRTVFITLFFYMVLFSYLMRQDAKVKAEGPLERWLPLALTVGIPVYFSFLLQEREIPALQIYCAGLFLTIYGWIISVRALWFLKYSFSIMAEVRELVTSGPYRSVRHPLYLGEFLILCGLSLMVFSWGALLGLVISTTFQVIRARIEERKLMKVYGERYALYRKHTGFFIPVLLPRYGRVMELHEH